ncbi:polyprenyl synthetase family protein [Streptomyces sp. NPDC051555]|uniref:polyprenyl synthetase family protein n=1 Tax=Streptomyces sp. NPDC051555 TaxID=3365657 RepID=UPI00379E8DA7
MSSQAIAAGPIDLADVRSQVDRVLSDFLDSKARAAAACGHPAEITETLQAFLTAGGKRIRPLLCVVGWHAAGGHGDTTTILHAAASLEMFVAFALIHDDLMDRSATRRGHPTVHRALSARHQDRTHAEQLGDSTALLSGNFALIWSEELLHTARFTPDQRESVHRFNDAMLAEVMFGQYRDLLGTDRFDTDVDAALQIIRYKTATGTVQRPLQIGAATAGADARVLDACTAIGLPLGEAFQLRDDLLGVFGSPGHTGKPNLDDLREGKRTVLLALALHHATPAQQRRLHALVGHPALEEHDAAEVRAIFEDTGAREHTERMIDARLRQALRALDKAAFPPHATTALRQLAHAATARTK